MIQQCFLVPFVIGRGAAIHLQGIHAYGISGLQFFDSRVELESQPFAFRNRVLVDQNSGQFMRQEMVLETEFKV